MDIFTAKTETWKAEMTRGQPSAGAPTTSVAEDRGHSKTPHTCSGCEGGSPCSKCGGNVQKTHAAYQALEWGMLISQSWTDPVWRTAAIGRAVATAPSRSDAPEWTAIDQIVRNTFAVEMLARQGRDALPSVFRLLSGFADDAYQADDKPPPPPGMGDGGESKDPGMGGDDKPPPPPGMGGDENKDSGMGGGITKDPAMGTPEFAGGNTDNCCCVAKDIYVAPIVWTRGFSHDSFDLWVYPIVGKGVGTPKGCSVEWEELPNYTYSAGDVNVIGGMYNNLSQTSAFQSMLKKKHKGYSMSADEALRMPCPEKARLPPILDQPLMGPGSTLTIRITLRSGCSPKAIVKYIVMIAPRIGDNPQLEGPWVVGEGDLFGGGLEKLIYDHTAHVTPR